MTMEEFSNAVLTAVRDKADGVFSVWLDKRSKNNGIQLTGIITSCTNRNVNPCVYLDDYYHAYEHNEMAMDEIMDAVYETIIENQKSYPAELNVTDFLTWNNIKGHIYYRLINAELNKEMLTAVPHRMFLDLAVVYYVKISGFSDKGIGTILIHNQYMDLWKQDEESIYQAAEANMGSGEYTSFDNIAVVLKCFTPQGIDIWDNSDIPDNIGMYVLTNKDKCFGASEILNKNTLRAVSDKIGGDFLILPSSVHEVIIVSSKGKSEYGIFAEMVREINASELRPDEKLSDHVYVYIRSEETLKLANHIQ